MSNRLNCEAPPQPKARAARESVSSCADCATATQPRAHVPVPDRTSPRDRDADTRENLPPRDASFPRAFRCRLTRDSRSARDATPVP